MQWKEPKNTSTHHWTNHVKMKMRHYGLSAQRIRTVIKRPLRVETGIAENTIAVMQPQSTRRDRVSGKKTWTSEIWVMYQLGKGQNKMQDVDVPASLVGIFQPQKKARVISAWRYPGVTKPGENLPEMVLDEIAEASL